MVSVPPPVVSGDGASDNTPSPPPPNQAAAKPSRNTGRDANGSSGTIQAAEGSQRPTSLDGCGASNARLPRTPAKRRTFGKVVRTPGDGSPSSPSLAGDTGPRLEDLYFQQVKSLPDVCEVTDPDLQDELLKDSYDGLPNLK